MNSEDKVRNRQHAAVRELERLRHEGDILTGLLRPTIAGETGSTDPIERWGRRIGRGLAVVAFLGFCVYFYVSYGH